MPAKPDAECSFVTDTATLAIFDPCCLKHRAMDAPDWWSIWTDEVEEINSGNVLFASLRTDGKYSCKIYRDQDTKKFSAKSVKANLKTELGCFYIGAGEQVPAGGIGCDTRHGGVIMCVPAGNWSVAVSLRSAQITIRFAPTTKKPQNKFKNSPQLA